MAKRTADPRLTHGDASETIEGVLGSDNSWKPRGHVRARRVLALAAGCAGASALLLGCGPPQVMEADASMASSPRLIYRHAPPTCPALARPEFNPPDIAGDVPGMPRWVRELQELSLSNSSYPFFPARPISRFAGLTSRGTSLWRDTDSSLIGFSYARGDVLYWNIGIAPGQAMWLSDGVAYEHGGTFVAGARICETGEACLATGMVGVDVPLLQAPPNPPPPPAWSPFTREVIAVAGLDLLYSGCTDGQSHWMLQLPWIGGLPAGLFVRENGEIFLVSDTSYILSPEGDVLRSAPIAPIGYVAVSAATYVEGCGALVAGLDRWAWVDPDTLTMSEPIVVPGERVALGTFSPTPDCGIIAVADVLTPTLLRFSRDGEVLWGVPTSSSRAPFVLEDGGFLVVALDGYQIFDADGQVRSTVQHEAPLTSCSLQSSSLAPDGTLFRLCAGDAVDNPYLTAIPTGVRPWGAYGPGEGIDFARTNAAPPRE